jgi:8-oxo-dGTP pyrophosphatase MutT (NUDIX family)
MHDRQLARPGDLIVALLGSYHPADAIEARDAARLAEVAATEHDPWARSAMLHATASALIVHPDSGRVLLRWHPRQQAWLQVGGHADPGEQDPMGIALREAQEETGLPDLRPWPGPELRHLVIVPVAAGNGEPAHEHADLRFVLATSTPDAVVAERAEAPLRWLAVDAAVRVTTEANLRETLDRVRRLLASSASSRKPA